MKNKHLLLLFLATIAVGLLARRVPWFKASLFQTNLIEVDTARLTQISVFLPDQPELLIERTESGWAATQEILATGVSGEHIAPMLAALASVRSLRIYDSERPDTLGFSKKTLIQVQTYRDDALLEQFEIGDEIIENGQPATWIRLSRHEGIYLVEQHLRGIFSKKLDDFRENRVADFEISSISGVSLENWEGGTKVRTRLSKNDTTAQWKLQAEQSIAEDSVLNWLRQFTRLNGSPFADHFDESSTRETNIGRLTLYRHASDSLVFQLYRIRRERSQARAGSPEYILHSTQNPGNFFAPPDTLLLRRIFFGWMPTGTVLPQME